MTAHGQVHGADEKEVKYYRHSISSDSSLEGGDGSVAKDQDAKPPASISTSTDRAHLPEFLKKLFCAYVDVNTQVDIAKVEFKWDKNDGVNFHALARKIRDEC